MLYTKSLMTDFFLTHSPRRSHVLLGQLLHREPGGSRVIDVRLLDAAVEVVFGLRRQEVERQRASAAATAAADQRIRRDERLAPSSRHSGQERSQDVVRLRRSVERHAAGGIAPDGRHAEHVRSGQERSFQWDVQPRAGVGHFSDCAAPAGGQCRQQRRRRQELPSGQLGRPLGPAGRRDRTDAAVDVGDGICGSRRRRVGVERRRQQRFEHAGERRFVRRLVDDF